MIAIALQRDSVDVGGNMGVLSIGELPEGVKNESMTWVRVPTYTTEQGGLAPPSDSLNEVCGILQPLLGSLKSLQTYPLAWEVPIDGIYIDGIRLPTSALLPNGTGLYAVVDTVSCSSVQTIWANF